MNKEIDFTKLKNSYEKIGLSNFRYPQEFKEQYKKISTISNKITKELLLERISADISKIKSMKETARIEDIEKFNSEIDLFKEFFEKVETLTDDQFKTIEKEFDEYVKKSNNKNKSNEDSPFFIFEKEAQAREFIKKQPLFFNKSEMWLIWDWEELKYKLTDKTEILNGIKKLGVNTINSKEKTEILNALQQVGRESMPKELNQYCIQFKNKIINIKTGEEFKSTPEYFSTNPIPWKIGDSEETPTMDKYFKEWVGEEYVKTLYQILAYSTSSNQFMQRMFAFVGGGSNGKGTFIKLLRKFIGKDNCVSSEMALLSSNGFETSSLYKKLVCEMGEVSQDDLQNTNQIKKLGGDDELRYCFKGKTPFTEFSPTTCIINTNSLPTTPDKTLGFYRKWLIIDFPNQFPIKTGIIESIPDKEFENLGRKSIRLLKEMYETRKFENEGTYQERMDRYEERSNPILKFIDDYCEEDFEAYLSLKKFSVALNDYLKSKHLRIMTPKEIKKKLSDEGFDVRRTTKFGIQDVFILCISLKNIPKDEIKNSCEELVLKNDIKQEIIKFFKVNSDCYFDFNKLQEVFNKCDNLLEILNKLQEEGLIHSPKANLWQYIR